MNKILSLLFQGAALATLFIAEPNHADENSVIVVTITPQQAIDDGARWRIDASPWYGSGYRLRGILNGGHIVKGFNVVERDPSSHCQAPEPMDIFVRPGKPNIIELPYKCDK